MGSKYLDLGLALFMGYFAYTRFENGQVGFGILFVVLCLMNLLTGFMKHKRANENMTDKK